MIMHLQERKSGMLLFIDFEKAFDSLELEYVVRVLQKYNFGDDFIKWFKVLYENSSSMVINNGHFSEAFKLGRGCRQGNSLSPFIFILCVEPLSKVIKLDKKITGINIGSAIHKIEQYADDTFVFLDGSYKSVYRTFEILDKYARVSGLKINLDKTQAVW